jgi:hypothetical protein
MARRTHLTALVPLVRYGVGLIRSDTQRPARAVFGNAALLVTFSVLHIAHCSGSCSRIVDGLLTLNLMIMMFTLVW